MGQFSHLSVLGSPHAAGARACAEHESTVPPRPLRVCMVLAESGGYLLDGGAALGAAGRAEALARAGLRVSLLVLPGAGRGRRTDSAEWIHYAQGRGIEVTWLPKTPPVRIAAYAHPRLSYRVLLWLRDREFDVAHFPDRGGYAYYSMLARRQGLAFSGTLFCVSVDGPTLWAQSTGVLPLPSGSIEDLTVDFMERQCLMLADAVVGSSEHVLSWVEQQGWRLPARTHICEAVIPEDLRTSARPSPSVAPVRELVFVAGLDRHREVDLFCSSLDRAMPLPGRDLRIAFLVPGSFGSHGAEAHVRYRARRWPCPTRVITGWLWREVVASLTSPGRAAVVGPSASVAPADPLSLVAAGPPLLLPAVGGTPEMVAAEDRDRACYEPRPSHLAERIRCMIERGEGPPRPALTVQMAERSWVHWHETIRRTLDAAASPGTAPSVALSPRAGSAAREARGANPSPPLVSVCVAHRNRPRYLEQALASLQHQDYPNFEVIVVDDGSTDPDAVTYLDRLEREFPSGRERLIRQENRYLGAARNTAVRHSRGAYVVFMDDDNYAKPHEISTLVAVAERTGADILTCLKDVFFGDDPPDPARPPVHRQLALGPSAAFAVFQNACGDPNALVRRDAFERLGGFTEDYGVGAEDQEFLTRAVLMGRGSKSCRRRCSGTACVARVSSTAPIGLTITSGASVPSSRQWARRCACFRCTRSASTSGPCTPRLREGLHGRCSCLAPYGDGFDLPTGRCCFGGSPPPRERVVLGPPWRGPRRLAATADERAVRGRSDASCA